MSPDSLATMVGVADRDLSELIAAMSRRQLTLASAESLTGGLLTALLTEVPGSSAVVRGGLVVYATELKHTLAGVDNALLAERGPVDPDVALALADGARITCGAEVGVGLTGVAGPDRQHGIAVGTWYVALSRAGGRDIVSHLSGQNGSSPAAGATRAQVRNAAVRAAIGLLAGLVADT